ncbi:CPXCG motif-containing cysteine-rich protein [Pseudoalteromonas sp. SMS1]|uniref:CPXCG motif-containing cysteine-rich protein n=1 Tax=Pseudoalteromonas sp. SMS1 TaxID=2908894 RepID=UPI001F1CE0B2|nr:CPXCG motif-containing cysteine-rich protein [Pseudoalteromonas sp. SMS1]MCF2859533.1 CPXCG motif-containing cysteine-rich protein [Pseudoalteromonas sp. SMS1]
MKQLYHQRISCPHCGHHIFIDLDTSEGDQDYYEDCAACCNPIHLNMHIDEAINKLELRIDSDDEQIF